MLKECEIDWKNTFLKVFSNFYSEQEKVVYSANFKKPFLI